MARQEQLQPRRPRRIDPELEQQLNSRNRLNLPERQTTNDSSKGASDAAGGALSDIDKVIAGGTGLPKDTSAGTDEWYDKSIGNNPPAPSTGFRSGSDPDAFADANDRFKDYHDADSNPQSPQEANKAGAKNINRQEGAAPNTFAYSGDDEGQQQNKQKGRGRNFGKGKRQSLRLVAGLGGVGIILGGMMGAGVLFKGNLFSGMLNDFFGKAAKHAVEHRLRAYMFGWVKKDLLEGAKRCGSTAKLTCINKNSPKAPKGMIGTFTLAMRQARVNEALVNKGISFSYKEGARGQPGTFKIITKQGVTEVPDTAEAIGRYNRQTFRNGKAFDREMKAVIAQHFDGAMRRKVVKAVRRNLGNKMCIVFCDRRDNNKLGLGAKYTARVEAYYNAWASIAGRTLLGASARHQVLLMCMLEDCGKDKIRDKLNDINTEEAKLLANDSRKLDELMEEGAKLRSQTRRVGVSKLFIRHLLSKMLKKETTDIIMNAGEKALGPVGMVLLAIAASSGIHRLVDLIYDYSGDHKLRMMWDESKKPLATGAFSMVTTGADEMFGAQDGDSKDFDLAALNAFNDRLKDIEKAPAYTYLFGSQTQAKNVNPSDVNLCKHYPQKLQDDTEGGHQQIFCADDRLGTDPPVIRNRKMLEAQYPAVFDMLDKFSRYQYYNSWLADKLQSYIINHINDVIGWIIAGNPVSKSIWGVLFFPLKLVLNWGPVKHAVDSMKDKIEDLMGDFFQAILPLAARDQNELRGPALATAAMVGGDYVYNQYSNGKKAEDGTISGLGAPEISKDQANQLYAEIEQEDREDLKYASVEDRYFSMSNPNSLLARTIVGGPAASAYTVKSFTAIASNPFSSILSSTASLLSLRVSAAPTIQRIGATGVPTHAYLNESKYLIAEPLELTEDECKQKIADGYEETDEYDRIGEKKRKITDEARQCMIDLETVGVGILESKGGDL